MQKNNFEQVKFMHKACQMCDKSSCGYKTGCIAVKNGKIIVEAWNETLPGEIYCQDGECIREKEGLSGGKDIEKVCSIHAEASVVAQAADKGISLNGCDIFVTTFPCIICARLLAKTGISNLFYMSNYPGENLGESLLQGANIRITQIQESDVWEYDAKLKE